MGICGTGRQGGPQRRRCDQRGLTVNFCPQISATASKRWLFQEIVRIIPVVCA